MHRRSSCVNRGSEISSIRYVDPITKILYHNYTMAACNPLYSNANLEDSRSTIRRNDKIQQYGEALNKFNREIYQWSMNINLNVSFENLHRSHFSTSDVKQSQIARIISYNSKGIINRDAFRDSHGKYSHENFIHRNDQFQQHFLKQMREPFFAI